MPNVWRNSIDLAAAFEVCGSGAAAVEEVGASPRPPSAIGCARESRPRLSAQYRTRKPNSSFPNKIKEIIVAIEHALYTAQATSTGGRTGTTTSSDGEINLSLATPKQLGGAGGPGTNPEQLFAAGYSACFIGAMKAVAAHDKIHLPAEVSIVADVEVGALVGKPGAFGISVDMAISVPGIDRDAAAALVAKAHEVCPYSNATRGNIDVVLTVV
jgi:lipoyl-dependent peroxiredoxin